MTKHIIDISDDAWLNICRAERLLGRDLTPEETEDVKKRGFRAACLRPWLDEEEKDKPETPWARAPSVQLVVANGP